MLGTLFCAKFGHIWNGVRTCKIWVNWLSAWPRIPHAGGSWPTYITSIAPLNAPMRLTILRKMGWINLPLALTLGGTKHIDVKFGLAKIFTESPWNTFVLYPATFFQSDTLTDLLMLLRTLVYSNPVHPVHLSTQFCFFFNVARRAFCERPFS